MSKLWSASFVLGIAVCAANAVRAEAHEPANEDPQRRLTSTSGEETSEENEKAGGGLSKGGESPARSAARMEEVVVTAQKRGEIEQDVPTSMVVLSAANLETQGMAQLNDYTKQIPGLKLIGGGEPGRGRPVLRGISTGTDAAALVAIFLDDVSFTSSISRGVMAGVAFDPALADIDHVEVLKGPQSTLYGASAMGGIIKFVSKRPNLNSLEGSARFESSYVDSGGDGYSARMSVNVPILKGDVAMRASAFYREDPGFINNVATGEKDVNTSDVKGGRITLLARVTDKIENTLTGLLQDVNTSEPYDVFLNRTTLEPTFGRPAFASSVDQGSSFKFRALNNTTQWDLKFATLSNIASYSEFSFETIYAAGLPMVFGAANGRGVVTAKSRWYSDELRLTSAPSQLEWLVGAYYSDEKNTSEQNNRGTDASGTIVPQADPAFDTYTFLNDQSSESIAAFGNATYHFTPKLGITLGLRFDDNQQDFDSRGTGRIYPPSNVYGPIGFPTSSSANSYLATLTYEPSSTLTVYARAASAYRPGGPNAITPDQRALGVPDSFDPDELWNYEVGTKGSAWDGKLAYSLAAYYIDWDKAQITVLTTVSNGNTYRTTGNVGKAEAKGVELSLGFRPASGLNLGINGAYNDAKITVASGALGAFPGDPLPYSPKLTLSGSADYRMVLSEAAEGSIGLSFVHYSEQNTAFTLGASAFQLPAYDALDVRAGVDWDKFSLVARVDNVTNKFAVTSAAVGAYPGSPLVGQILRPRLYSLAIEVRL